ncbi:MAG TPA: hypothetical protein VNG71_03770, partial [Pyrinomonadaceae bacterium]|nr:hypothetical protein [Pyrinomonadaceae bacterium]
MRSFIALTFFSPSGVLLPGVNPLILNSVVSEPDLTDEFDAIIGIVTSVYDFFTGDRKKAAEEAIKSISELVSGKDVKNLRTSELSFVQGGIVPFALPDFADPLHPKPPVADQVTVFFRSFSDDDLTNTLGRVDQTDDGVQIIDLGEARFTEGDNKFFDRTFSIPLSRMPVGENVFSFGAADDGFFFDVAVASTLTIKIVPDPNAAANAASAGFSFNSTEMAALIKA